MRVAGRFSVKLYAPLFSQHHNYSPRLLQLLNSNRIGQSRAAYKEVQERHEDIKRIERTLGELAQLFNDVNYSLFSLFRFSCLMQFLDECSCGTAR